jgi:nucleoid DNA-binding protein
MLTKDFISLIANQSGLSKKETEQLLASMNAIVRENLMDGKSIQILGLGALEIKERKARTIVHPRTGERSVSPSRSQLVFRPVANIKDELKNN